MDEENASPRPGKLGQVRNAQVRMFHRIMVAWDGSAVAEHALRIARDVADHYAAHLTVVSVLELPVHAEAREDRERTVREQTEHYTQTLARTKLGLADAPAELRHEFLQGMDPARTICAYAHEHGYDLIVIGRGHRGIIQRSLVGDVTTAVSRNARCPVLVVGTET